MYWLNFLKAQNAAAPKLPHLKNQKPAAGGANTAKFKQKRSILEFGGVLVCISLPHEPLALPLIRSSVKSAQDFSTRCERFSRQGRGTSEKLQKREAPTQRCMPNFHMHTFWPNFLTHPGGFRARQKVGAKTFCFDILMDRRPSRVYSRQVLSLVKRPIWGGIETTSAVSVSQVIAQFQALASCILLYRPADLSQSCGSAWRSVVAKPRSQGVGAIDDVRVRTVGMR